MRMTKRSSYQEDEEVINKLLENEMNQRRKTKFTDFLCSLINYVSLIPTLIYSAVWYFYLKSVLENFINEDALLQGQVQGCLELYQWVNYCLTWTMISFFKAVFLLTCVKLCCGGENDCNLCCLLIKSISSLIPSIIFVLKLPDTINNYNVYNTNVIELKDNNLLKIGCDNMASTLSLYYKWEYSYVLFVLLLFCLIPAGAMAMCFKEIWKSRGYNKET
jgi:hypothetical protein